MFYESYHFEGETIQTFGMEYPASLKATYEPILRQNRKPGRMIGDGIQRIPARLMSVSNRQSVQGQIGDDGEQNGTAVAGPVGGGGTEPCLASRRPLGAVPEMADTSIGSVRPTSEAEQAPDTTATITKASPLDVRDLIIGHIPGGFRVSNGAPEAMFQSGGAADGKLQRDFHVGQVLECQNR